MLCIEGNLAYHFRYWENNIFSLVEKFFMQYLWTTVSIHSSQFYSIQIFSSIFRQNSCVSKISKVGHLFCDASEEKDHIGITLSVGLSVGHTMFCWCCMHSAE